MGGNALKDQVETRRISSAEHAELSRALLASLGVLFPSVRATGVESYAIKPDHGDIDLLIELDALPEDWQQQVLSHFSPRGSRTQKNSDMVSFEHQGVQIDLIGTPSHHFDWTCRYLSFNDFGNLIGVVARDLGFRFGHNGLWFTLYAPGHATQVIEDLCITQSREGWDVALKFLGWDPQRYAHGFDSLQDIFEFVVSGDRFRPEIYTLASRSHDRRARDTKRKTYMSFLEFLSQRSWPASRVPNRSALLDRAFEVFPDFAERYAVAADRCVRRRVFASRFNGEAVARLTGLEGIALGRHMEGLRASFDSYEDLERFVLVAEPGDLDRFLTQGRGARLSM